MTKKIVLLGSSGLLGRALQDILGEFYDVLAPLRKELELSDLAAVSEYLADHSPDMVVNAAALTGVQACEENPELAYQINTELPRQLAESCSALEHCLLVHFSCLDVYGDIKPAHGRALCLEDSAAHPQSVYAKTKLQGDIAIQQIIENHLVFRLGGLYRARDLSAVVTREPFSLGAPTEVGYIANMLARSLNRVERKVLRIHPGIYHFTTKGEADWQTFHREVAAQRRAGQIVMGTSPELVAKASRISVEKVEDAFCLFIPTWQAQLKNLLMSEKSQERAS